MDVQGKWMVTLHDHQQSGKAKCWDKPGQEDGISEKVPVSVVSAGPHEGGYIERITPYLGLLVSTLATFS